MKTAKSSQPSLPSTVPNVDLICSPPPLLLLCGHFRISAAAVISKLTRLKHTFALEQAKGKGKQTLDRRRFLLSPYSNETTTFRGGGKGRDNDFDFDDHFDGFDFDLSTQLAEHFLTFGWANRKSLSLASACLFACLSACQSLVC